LLRPKELGRRTKYTMIKMFFKHDWCVLLIFELSEKDTKSQTVHALALVTHPTVLD
jgi:hypothetical protein